MFLSVHLQDGDSKGTGNVYNNLLLRGILAQEQNRH
jgi:hypothetical protein